MTKRIMRNVALGLGLTLLSAKLWATEIQLLDRQGKLLRTLTKPAEIQAFQQIWEKKQPVALFAKPDWDYQIKIKPHKQTQQTWWYASDGHAQQQDNADKGPYRLAQFAQLNDLLAIKIASTR